MPGNSTCGEQVGWQTWSSPTVGRMWILDPYNMTLMSKYMYGEKKNFPSFGQCPKENIKFLARCCLRQEERWKGCWEWPPLFHLFFTTASALKIDQVAGIVQNTSNKPLLTVITFETSKNLVFPKAWIDQFWMEIEIPAFGGRVLNASHQTNLFCYSCMSAIKFQMQLEIKRHFEEKCVYWHGGKEKITKNLSLL